MTRHSTFVALLVSAVFAAPAISQGMPEPSPELKRYDSWLGTWTGEGQWHMAPGGDAMPWKSKTTYQKVMNGFFIMEQTKVEGEGMPMPLCFTTYIGWDNENQRHMKLEIGNGGTVRMSELHWTADNQTVSYMSGMEPMNGEPFQERWVATQTGETIQFSGQMSQGAGPMFSHVSGTMQKTNEKAEELEMPAGSFMPMDAMPYAKKGKDHMAKIAGMAGNYRTEGWWSMPGGPKESFTGTEKVAPHFDGTVMSFTTLSDPMENMGGMRYGMNAWVTYNVHDTCYEMHFISSMGEIGSIKMWLMDGKLVTAGMMSMMGVPMVSRGVMGINKDGSIATMTGHAMAAYNDPTQNFFCKYTKQEQ